jgi:hypothetical protein
LHLFRRGAEKPLTVATTLDSVVERGSEQTKNRSFTLFFPLIWWALYGGQIINWPFGRGLVRSADVNGDDIM